MNKENIIKKITINIGGTEVDVTPQQAKDLHEALEQLLNVQPKTVEKHIYHEYPYWYWPYNQPTWPTINCGTSNLDRCTVSYLADNQSVNMLIT